VRISTLNPPPDGPQIREAALALPELAKEYERLTVEAAVEESYPKALAARTAHPLVGSRELARAILDDYLDAHAEFLGHLAP